MTTRQEAINLKCKECAYDELDDGTWRQKVERCEITDCPLWKYKPKSRSKASSVAHSVAVQPHFGVVYAECWGRARISPHPTDLSTN
jgi:hypothetical protein